jgi:hypothetical protein
MEYTAKHFGYEDTDMLMQVNTGHVDTAKNWAEDVLDWDTEEATIEEQFSTLVKVKATNEGWEEV